IIVLEKGEVGSGSSSRAAGIITGHLWSETGVRARKISLQRYRELSEELDGYTFQASGTLNLFDAISWEEREAMLPLYEQLDVPYEVLDATEIHYRWPELTPDPESGIAGLYDPLGGYSEPHRYIPAIAAKARQLGVDIRENQIVTGFERSGDTYVGVQTQNGTIPAERIISASHIWTNHLLETGGLQLPMRTIVHQRYVTAPLAKAVNIPVVNANPYGAYVRPAEGNCILAGYETPDPALFDVPGMDFDMASVSTPEVYQQRLKDNLIPLFPRLKDTTWATEHVGLLSFSADEEPILGELSPGLIVAGSFHSGGFAYNPVAGLLLAETALGEKSSINLDAFAPTRFANVDPDKLQQKRKSSSIQRRH
ncbi:MAG: FAD-binding oxidoreductase, partial [Anaerolineae bacterium]|nr:FAD-binding oxidoreductase [Anaerolineae bacterium]